MTTTPRVGVVGVGRMGANIARRLEDAGYAVTAVADTDRARAEALAAELGAEVPATLAGLTAVCDVVLTVVSDDAAMRAIFAAEGDSLLRGAGGKVFVNCATISPEVHVEVDALARDAGASAVEACMASSIPQAREGTLYLICGGDAADQVQCPLAGLRDRARHAGFDRTRPRRRGECIDLHVHLWRDRRAVHEDLAARAAQQRVALGGEDRAHRGVVADGGEAG